jgi:Bacterial protein of unknown function (DUF922)
MQYGRSKRTWICGRYLLLVLVPVLIFSFKQYKNEKSWNQNQPLSWDDFQGYEKAPNFNRRTVSHTLCGERWAWKPVVIDSNKNSFKFIFAVKTVMVKNLSWVDPLYKTSKLLQHEQLHFDIAEYFSRQLLRAFQNRSYTANYREEIKQVRHIITLKRNEIQDLYDQQTNHSQNENMQAKWQLYINDLLVSNLSLDSALNRLPNKKLR